MAIPRGQVSVVLGLQWEDWRLPLSECHGALAYMLSLGDESDVSDVRDPSSHSPGDPSSR